MPIESPKEDFPGEIRAFIEPSKEDVMDYVSGMLFQLAELSERCGERAIAQSLHTLVSDWENRNSNLHQKV